MPSKKPTCAFTPATYAGSCHIPIAVNLSASSPNGAISSWVITWGDGESSTGSGPVPLVEAHTYLLGKVYGARLRVTDVIGQTAVGNAKITIRCVSQPPVATLTVTPPANASAVSPDGNPVPVAFADATTTGGTAPVVVTAQPASGSLFAVGTTTVAIVATSADGQVAHASLTVTVTTSPPPPPPPPPPTLVLTVPANQSVISPAGTPLAVAFPAPTTVGGTAPVQITAQPASGSVFPIGVTSVGVVATSADGQSVSGTFTVTVTVPATPPPALTVTCPGNQIAASPDGGQVAVAFAAPVVAGGVAPVVASYDHVSGSLFPIGVTTVTATATSADGQTATCQFTVTITYVAPAPTPGDPTTLPLLQASDLVYVGAFRMPGDDSAFAFGGTQIAFNPVSGGLFVGSPRTSDRGIPTVAEVTIPAHPVNSNILANLPVAVLIQDPLDPTEGHLDVSNDAGPSPTPASLGGLVVSGGFLYGSAGIYYDALDGLRSSQYRRSPTLATPSFEGFKPLWQLTSQGFVSGYLGTIPPVWQALLKGDIFDGNFGHPIISRMSWGPNAIAWPTAQFAQTLIPAQPLVYYSSDHPTLGIWADQNINFGMGTSGSGAMFPVGTRSLLAFGVTGLGPACYGESTNDPALAGTPPPDDPGGAYCYDPTDGNKGPHTYPYRWNVWGYDANDLLAVVNGTKNPWDVLPYTNFGLTFPIGVPSASGMGGIAYDPVTQRLFIVQLEVDGGISGRAGKPLVHVFQLPI